MHSIHLRDMHVPRGPNMRLAAISAVFIFSVSLALFLILSFLSGDGFRDSMGGDVGLAFLIVGLVLSIVFAIVERKNS